MNFNLFKNKSLAIDLGNNNTLVSDKDNLLVSQPSYIVFDAHNNAVKAVGDKAYSMFEKSHEELRPIKPLKGGVIADYDSASRMIHELIKQANRGTSFLSGYENIISGIPYSTTEVERRALRDALGQFNARHTYLLYEPLAAALGLGLDIREPEGKMVIDIGGGITEIVIISLSGIAAFQSVKIAGDTFDEAIQDHFRRSYNMAIGLKTAEQVKIKVGAVQNDLKEAPAPMMVRGKDLMEGIPVVRRVDHAEVVYILEKSVAAIEHAIIQTLETCPPELAADIYVNGINITGGNAYLRGLKERFESRIKLPVHIDPQALLSVSKGIAKALQDPKKYQSVLVA
ncbi:rod shape-determining protein [Fulvivirgaceae bacterium PWU5]|uniref:Cell shape-determining protein MreB n=1 Tax=Dawidia cretensis TaxID=2782350 RepID=A0AAP2DZC0_9BACT|nr:rod shape-determining protein [Dawidia cretensis]MBT1709209.1 rod shape-determining protein [Dawidia cretensis]